MKLGMYSITYLGIWYKGGALGMKEMFERSKKMGYAGVELDGKRPHCNPMDLDAAARREIRAIATDLGMDIPAVAANNDFSSPVPEQWECQLLMARELIELASDVGSPVVRLFVAWPGVTYRGDGLAQYDIARRRWEETWRDTTRQEVWDAARKALTECAAIAQDLGVTLALQNHTPVVRHYGDVITMVEEVDSPALQICLDAPLLTDQSAEAVERAVRDVGIRQVHSHFGGEFARGEDGKVDQRPLHMGEPRVNYETFVDSLRAVGYEGYLCYEFCHPAPDLVYVDEQAELAANYLGALIG